LKFLGRFRKQSCLARAANANGEININRIGARILRDKTQQIIGISINSWHISNVKSKFKLLVAVLSFAKIGKQVGLVGSLFWLGIFYNASTKPVLNPADPVDFFTAIAGKLLRNTFSFGVTNILVYSNGAFVYTPSVQRLLQLSANIYDASKTNFYPTVFRPIFEHDDFRNICISGYTNLSSAYGSNTVTGESDP
jgi:hypothetical protein